MAHQTYAGDLRDSAEPACSTSALCAASLCWETALFTVIPSTLGDMLSRAFPQVRPRDANIEQVCSMPLQPEAEASQVSWGCVWVRVKGVRLRRKERMDRIKRLRWQQRSLPDSIKINLSPQETQVRRLPQSWIRLPSSHEHLQTRPVRFQMW